MGLAATLLAGAAPPGAIDPIAGVLLLACVGVPYLLVLVDGSRFVSRLPLPGRTRAALVSILSERAAAHAPDANQDDRERATAEVHPHHALWIVLDLALIVAGSFGMVQAAVSLGGHWGLSGALARGARARPARRASPTPSRVCGWDSRGAGRRSSAQTPHQQHTNLAGGVMVPALFVRGWGRFEH